MILGAVLLIAPEMLRAQDRFVEACEVAVSAHARKISLSFPASSRTDREVRVFFSFERKGEHSSGEATCSFSERPVSEPPSLDRFVLMGRHNATLFLIAYHAIWNHFADRDAGHLSGSR